MSDNYDLKVKKEIEQDIVEIKQWKNRTTGKTLIEERSYPKDSSVPTSSVYYGKIQIKTNMGPLGMQFRFPPEYGTDECFENFDKHAEAALKQMENDQKSQIISGAGLVDPKAIRA